MKCISSSDNGFSLFFKASRTLAASLPIVFLPGWGTHLVCSMGALYQLSRVTGGGNTGVPSPSHALIFTSCQSPYSSKVSPQTTRFSSVHTRLFSCISSIFTLFGHSWLTHLAFLRFHFTISAHWVGWSSSVSTNCLAPPDNFPRSLSRPLASSGHSVFKLKIICLQQCRSQVQKHMPRRVLCFIFNLWKKIGLIIYTTDDTCYILGLSFLISNRELIHTWAAKCCQHCSEWVHARSQQAGKYLLS